MKKTKTALLISVLISIVLEALPFGAVCNFAEPGGSIRKTFSYFSLTPFGYANFGPFLTAILSCVILILAVILLTGKGKRTASVTAGISAVSVITSLMPLMYGIDYYSVLGGAVSVFMIINFTLTMIIKRGEKNET